MMRKIIFTNNDIVRSEYTHVYACVCECVYVYL